VTATEIAHKGGRTFAYRVESDGTSLVYAPDHQPNAGISDEALGVMSGVDVLIHDAQFLEPERFFADAYGHATVADAIGVAESVGARILVLFHHGPNRTDDALDRILDGLSPGVEVVVAAEGGTLDLTASSR
jgi:ribonuclease BN (tRNA processing enzyme)